MPSEPFVEFADILNKVNSYKNSVKLTNVAEVLNAMAEFFKKSL